MAEAKEIELLCNNLRCRVALNTLGEAVVTNCSHIFCGPCANSLIGTERICPACNAHLPGSDEITTMSLSPHTEWKASVLSGLSPGLILEIAQRAMSFWTYQTSQLSAFQEYVVNQAKERVHGLEAQLHQAEEGRQAQERENQKLREKLEHQQAHLYKISDELKTVKDELNRVSTQKRQLLLKQPLGNAMDLQEAVNGQLFFDNEDDMAGVGAGYGGVRTRRRNMFVSARSLALSSCPH
ncbi:hypothetical protein HD553DRAFT_28045 [Filobasidium floriforme]|uniref:uncharacterized protein n=1 Tax=Filobasidium floriforme TaxID=5210 RepID=UPI001E8CDF44|nr:uncharacterized protein HD553DRAFT_28045 [Filobasidium floriforme]KAH8085394.1 hypothetical protein HD553DRAFT_28045 [Filobasidium floriforme]